MCRGLTRRIWITRPEDISRWLSAGFSTYNLGTFTYGNIPPYMSSLAEQDLLLAEIAAKNIASTGKSAADHVKDAVIHSTDMWYHINSLSEIWNIQGMPAKTDFLAKAFQPQKPGAAAIEQFADKIKAEFAAASGVEGQMDIIMQQKFVHLNILNYLELWAELRRTRHPKLEKLHVLNKYMAPIAERARYPSSEEQNNRENFNSVNSENNFTSPIFWVPSEKLTESAYMDGYLSNPGFLPLE